MNTNITSSRAGGTDLVSVTEAARILRVSPSTIWRWIAHDTVPAYRVGPKRVWLKTRDLEPLMETAREPLRKGGEHVEKDIVHERPLTAAERERGLAAIEEARQFQSTLLASRGGTPFESSWELLAESRDERSRELS